MSQNNDCGCERPIKELTVRGLKLSVDAEGIIPSGGLDLKWDVEVKTDTLLFGQPVYLKMFSFGSMPYAQERQVLHGIPDVVWMKLYEPYSYVYIPAIKHYPITTVFPDDPAKGWSYWTSFDTVAITTGADWRKYQATLCLMYTKTTDTPLP